MKKVLFLTVCLFTILTIEAQEIKGKLLDDENQPLPFATLQLLKSDSSLLKIETSKGDGTFRFQNLKAETYFLSISFVGYKTVYRTVDLRVNNGNLKSIVLPRQSTELQEVEIVAEKPMIEVEPDKTVFNVSKNLSTTGDNGIELLRKAPGLQIDNNDNIVLEGKSGVNVYVNGKQRFLQGQDLSNYLKSLRAEEMEKIEIITQPSSKYDAAGNAGILNIVLKREKGLGTKGTLTNTFTYGDFARNNTAITLNHRAKKFAGYGSFSHYQGKKTRFFNMYREQSANVFDGENDTEYESMNDRLNLGGDYYLSKNSTLSFSATGNWNDNTTESDSRTLISQTDDFIVYSILLAPNVNESKVDNYTANINYSYKDTNDRSLELDVDYVNFSNKTDSYQPNIYTSPDEGIILNQNINFQTTPIEIEAISAKADYEQKVGKGTLALGTKVSQVSTYNVFDFFDEENGVRILNNDRSNTFEYEETIAAAYLNYKMSIKKLKIQGGIRAEQTYSKGDLQSNTNVSNKVVKREYLNWFPSAGLTYQLNRNNSTALIYSRRIQRPNYQNLNPFETQINELGFRRGNPFLQPQFTHNLKLSNTYKYTLNTSFTYTYINDYFAEVTEAEGDRVSFINTRNVADQQVYNLSVSYPKKIKEWWSVYGSVYGYFTKFTANHPDFIPIDRIVYGGFAQSTFNLPKKYRLEVSGWYSSPSIWRGTFLTKSLGALNIAVQKNWKQFTAKLSFNDVFHTIPWRANNRFGDLFLTGTGGGDSRNVSLFFSFAFGQNDVKTARKRKSASEDEQNRMK